MILLAKGAKIDGHVINRVFEYTTDDNKAGKASIIQHLIQNYAELFNSHSHSKFENINAIWCAAGWGTAN